MDHDELLTQRLNKLERQNTLLLCLVGALTLLCLVFVFWFGRRTTTVKQLELVDSEGKPLIKLSSQDSQTCLEMQGREKVATISLCAADKGGANLVMFDARNGSRVVLTAGGKAIDTLRPPESGLKERPSSEPSAASPSGLFVEDEKNQRVFDVTVGDEANLLIGRISKKDSLLLSTSDSNPQLVVMKGEVAQPSAKN